MASYKPKEYLLVGIFNSLLAGLSLDRRVLFPRLLPLLRGRRIDVNLSLSFQRLFVPGIGVMMV